LAGFVTGCKPQGTSAFTAHISLTYGVYLVFHLSGAIPLPAFKKRNHAVLWFIFCAIARTIEEATEGQVGL